MSKAVNLRLIDPCNNECILLIGIHHFRVHLTKYGREKFRLDFVGGF